MLRITLLILVGEFDVFLQDHISGVMVNIVNTVDHGFNTPSGQDREYKIRICCFSAKASNTNEQRTKTGRLGIGDNVSEWSDVYPWTIVSVG